MDAGLVFSPQGAHNPSVVALRRDDDGRWIVELDDPAVRAEGAGLNETISRALELAGRALGGGDLRRTVRVLQDLVEAIEDELDVAAAEQALAEPGDNISLAQLKAELDL